MHTNERLRNNDNNKSGSTVFISPVIYRLLQTHSSDDNIQTLLIIIKCAIEKEFEIKYYT